MVLNSSIPVPPFTSAPIAVPLSPTLHHKLLAIIGGVAILRRNLVSQPVSNSVVTVFHLPVLAVRCRIMEMVKDYEDPTGDVGGLDVSSLIMMN